MAITDVPEFTHLTDADIESLGVELDAIRQDIELGRKLEVNSTPTFFITAKGKTEKVASVVQYPILKRYLDYLLGQ